MRNAGSSLVLPEVLQSWQFLVLRSASISISGELAETTGPEEILLSELRSLSIISEGLLDIFCESNFEDILINKMV